MDKVNVFNRLKATAVANVHREHRRDYLVDCARRNTDLFKFALAGIEVTLVFAIATDVILSGDRSVLFTPQGVARLAAFTGALVAALLFSRVSSVNDRNYHYVFALQFFTMGLATAYTMSLQIIGEPDALAVFVALICFIGGGFSCVVSAINIMLWLSFIGYAAAALIFAPTDYYLVVDSLAVTLTLTVVAIISSNRRVKAFMQDVHFWLQQDDLINANNKLQTVNRKLEAISKIDALTGLYNRRNFDEFLTSEFTSAANNQRPLSILMMDVDLFKKYNDVYGHPQGDECLKMVAKAISVCKRRDNDQAFRYGGEEFALILPNTDEEGAVNLAERVIRSVREMALPHAQGVLPVVTISVGVYALDGDKRKRPAPPIDMKEFVNRADIALYAAKQNGRNRHEVYKG